MEQLYRIKSGLFFGSVDKIEKENIPESQIDAELAKYEPADMYEWFYKELQE